MKLSKSLLQAILVGVTLTTSAASCALTEELKPTDVQQCEKDKANENQENGNVEPFDCPGCGRG